MEKIINYIQEEIEQLERFLEASKDKGYTLYPDWLGMYLRLSARREMGEALTVMEEDESLVIFIGQEHKTGDPIIKLPYPETQSSENGIEFITELMELLTYFHNGLKDSQQVFDNPYCN